LTDLWASARAGVQMEMQMDTQTEKSWYRSKGVVGAVVAVAALGASMAGYQVAPDVQAQAVDAWLNVVALGGVVISLIGRLTASKRVS
jgi:hypothetical protein